MSKSTKVNAEVRMPLVPAPQAEVMRRMKNVGRFETWSAVERHAAKTVARRDAERKSAVAACIKAASA